MHDQRYTLRADERGRQPRGTAWTLRKGRRMSTVAATTRVLERVKRWDTNNREYKREANRQGARRRREAHALSHEYDEVMSSSEAEDSNLLYIMRYEFDPCGTMGIKIGRSKNLAARVQQLEASHNFRMKVLRVYRGLGNLEPIVKELLKSKRANGGAGAEWYDVSFATAMKAVALARALGPDDDLQEAASALSESVEDEDEPPSKAGGAGMRILELEAIWREAFVL